MPATLSLLAQWQCSVFPALCLLYFIKDLTVRAKQSCLFFKFIHS